MALGYKPIWQRIVALSLMLVLPVNAMADDNHELANSGWRPIEIAGKPIASDTKARLHFRDDGAIAAHGGCNQMGASFTADKATLRFGLLRATRRGCVPEIMAVEAAFAGALEATRVYLRNEHTLTLKNAQGATTMRLVASP